MLTCAITLSVSFDDTVSPDLDVRISTSEVDTAPDIIQQDVEVRVRAASGACNTVVAMPAPRHPSAPVSTASPLQDDYVLGGYAGI